MDLRLLGPAPSPIAMIRGFRRYQFMIKGQNWDKIRQIYFYLMKMPEAKLFRVFLDLDPVNMM